ncbi:helix-turn-helix domain-containing protein [Mesorhizobium koreense]|uniref:helix-turn-helix domain-containing protein n=1 Tax=Mesorhizobium koreense TaxID=3074855 RepID=UPI00287BB1A6|nr:helix-turn-helix transcriptional regulator [Mesorhizobium sp. WR6]
MQSKEAAVIVPNEILRAARSALGMSQAELAELSGVGERTILRVERNERVAIRTLQRLRAALEGQGVEFLASESGHGPGLRIPLEQIKRDDLRF